MSSRYLKAVLIPLFFLLLALPMASAAWKERNLPAAQQTSAGGQTLSGNITAPGQQVIYTFNEQANESNTLTLTPTSPVDQTLVCGTLLSDTIGAAGEVDQIIFSGQTGQVIDLTLVQTAGFDAFHGVLARFTLFSPTGAQLGAFDANTQRSFTLPETGTYLVRVNANNLVSTGSYNLGLECRQPLGPVDGTLNCGSLLSGTIEAAGEVDLVTFSGQTGQVIDLTLVQTAGFDAFHGVLARFTLFSPTGAQLGAFDANTQQSFTLPETGTYLVRVNANNLVSTGSYNFGLECRQPLGPVDGTLNCGSLLSGTIEAAGEADLITFSGQTGQVIDLTLVQTAGFDAFHGVLARFTLFSPTGAQLGAFDANTQRSFTLPETGTYLVRVNANNLFHTGSYNLGLGCLPSSITITLTPNPLTITAGTSGNMTATISTAQSTATTVTLSSSNTAAALVPAEVVIPANTASAAFLVVGVSPGSATMTAMLPTSLGGGTGTAQVTVASPNPQADLTITKTASPNPVGAGANLTYTITVTNNGPNVAESVKVVESLPDSVMFDSCSATGGGVCGGSGNNREVTFASLASGASATITLTAKVNCSVPDGAAIGNTATIISSTADPTSSNNTATANVNVSNLAKIMPMSQTFPPEGGMGMFEVTAPGGCAWTASTAEGWITTKPPASGSGNGKVEFSVAANPTGAPRMGEIKINGLGNELTFKVTQDSGRIVRAISNNVAQCGTVSVPIELVAQGDENALGFSLSFDPALLAEPQATLGSGASGAVLNTNSSQVAQGRLGIALALPAGQTFAAGTRQLMIVTFSVAATTSATTTIGFGDQPIAREVISAQATSLSPTLYLAGTIAVCPDLEADVAPRPNGNGGVSVADWTQVGRFAAGLDTLNSGSEFRRADCAPKETKGDGKITLADWVQAGRYAAGLDPVVPVGGPTSLTLTLSPGPDLAAPRAVTEAMGVRMVRVIKGSSEPGQITSLTIELDAQGNENALGFSLSFDPARWRFVAASAGDGVSGAAINLNTNQAARGRIGLALALPAGETFSAGTHQIVVVRLAPLSGSSANFSVIGFADQPIAREVADVNANAVPATYTLSTSNLRAATIVSAASYTEAELASEAIATAFGTRLATATQAAETLPLPTTLAGTQVAVRDSQGVERLALLFFVSPTQINYQIPPETALGFATVTITSGDGTVSIGTVEIAQVAPGLFTANANGTGVTVGLALRVKADGQADYEPIAQFDPAQNKFVPVALNLGTENEQVFLLLYGTGLRGRSDLSNVKVKIGGRDAPVMFAGAQGDFAGLDQINVLLPQDSIQRGEVEVILMVDGKIANRVQLSIR